MKQTRPSRIHCMAVVAVVTGMVSCQPSPYHDLDYAARELDDPPARTGPFNPNGKPVGAQVGKLAPEIEGVDLDGNAFRLSDYRGQVVVLSFFGMW